MCGSPLSEVGNELTQMKPCGADSIRRYSNVNLVLSWMNRAPIGVSDASR